MPYLFWSILLFSSISFLVYGGFCVLTDKMNPEFERYGFLKYQKLIGVLEILGALGLLLGYFIPLLLTISSLCLSLLMLSALMVRIKINDPFMLHLPALFLLSANTYIFFKSFEF
jgi:hypothetical protein